MSRLTQDGTDESVSRDHIIICEMGQGNMIFSCSADHEEDWQYFPVGPYFAMDQGEDSPKQAGPC